MSVLTKLLIQIADHNIPSNYEKLDSVVVNEILSYVKLNLSEVIKDADPVKLYFNNEYSVICTIGSAKENIFYIPYSHLNEFLFNYVKSIPNKSLWRHHHFQNKD